MHRSTSLGDRAAIGAKCTASARLITGSRASSGPAPGG
jgi:hypothetical protein